MNAFLGSVQHTNNKPLFFQKSQLKKHGLDHLLAKNVYATQNLQRSIDAYNKFHITTTV